MPTARRQLLPTLQLCFYTRLRPTEVRMRIIINGAGIAGPTLAYWLRKAGHEVVLVEAAPQVRTGGYAIDFGLVGYDIAEKMGLIPGSESWVTR